MISGLPVPDAFPGVTMVRRQNQNQSGRRISEEAMNAGFRGRGARLNPSLQGDLNRIQSTGDFDFNVDIPTTVTVGLPVFNAGDVRGWDVVTDRIR